jgi:hypothetical protein
MHTQQAGQDEQRILSHLMIVFLQVTPSHASPPCAALPMRPAFGRRATSNKDMMFPVLLVRRWARDVT